MKPTKEQIADWKKAYGKVYEITVQNEDDTGDPVIEGGKSQYIGWFKKVGRKILSFASRESQGLQDPIKFNEAIVRSCYLAGDEELKNQSEFIDAVSAKLNADIKQVEAEVKNL